MSDLPEQKAEKYITHRYFGTALISLFASLIVFVIYLTEMLGTALDKQEDAIKSYIERQMSDTRAAISADLQGNKDRVTTLINASDKARNDSLIAASARFEAALTSMNRRLDTTTQSLDKRFSSFSEHVGSQMRTIQNQVGILTADLIALGRMQVTDDMMRRMIADAMARTRPRRLDEAGGNRVDSN